MRLSSMSASTHCYIARMERLAESKNLFQKPKAADAESKIW